MTSLQMTVKSTPAAWERSAGTTAYWLESPSPGSPSSRNEAASPSPRRTTKSGSRPCSSARRRAFRTQAARARSTGS